MSSLTVRDAHGRAVLTVDPGTWIVTAANGATLRLAVNEKDHGRKQRGPVRGKGLVACLCPTWEAKRGWLDLVLAQFAAQTHPARLLFIADGSPDPVDLAAATLLDERIVYLHAPGASLPARRTLLLEHARRVGADWFAWFDDDELRNPRWLERVLVQWDGRADALTPSGNRFFDPQTGAVRDYRSDGLSLSSGVFSTAACAGVRFREEFPEDVRWLAHLSATRTWQRVPGYFTWNVAHDENIWNTRVRVFGGPMTDDYYVTMWKTFPLFCCRHDAYRTIDAGLFVEHLRSRHDVRVTLDALVGASDDAHDAATVATGAVDTAVVDEVLRALGDDEEE